VNSTSQSKKYALYIIAFLLVLNVFAWVVAYDLSQPRFLEVTFFDIGQGDAIFIETPQSHQILIDGGPTSIILEKLAKEMPFWDRSIDLIILTHPEHDHISGLLEVLKSYEVENILWTGIIRDTAEYQEWERLIKEEEAEIKVAKAGQRIKCLTSGVKQCELKVLYPFENLEGQEFKNSNNTSIVVKLIYDGSSFLFTGDAYKSIERKLIERGSKIDSDILKVGHHGSKTSSAQEFIEAVSPEIAIISAGRDNKYGHPHQEVLERLKNYGIRILRTDKEGDIKIISDGITLLITNLNELRI
jgi:competence protein ComEC